MAKSKITRRNGYIYGPGTRAGFLRMQRMGIPRPPFKLEDKIARILKVRYQKLVKELIKDFLKAAKASNAIVQDAAIPADDENLEELLNFFEEMGKQLQESKKAVEEAQNKANLANVASTLEKEWFEQMEPAPVQDPALEKTIDLALKQDQADFLGKLLKDADDKTYEILATFSIDKQQVFNDNMEQLRKLYLDNSLARIGWEQDYIKRAMLRRITAYVTGQDDKLRLDDLTKLAYARGDHMARLFARDQMARFNKALTIATFQNGDVTKVKWVTSHDARVRQSHKDLDGKIFNLSDLPPEVDDYNCRCGLVPVEWRE